MISKKLNIAKSNNSIPTWAIPFPEIAFTCFLDFDVPQSVTVPAGVNIAVISYTAGPNVIVNEGAPEAIPPLGGPVTPTKGRINPPSLWVEPGTILSFTSASSGGDIISVAFYTNDEG